VGGGEWSALTEGLPSQVQAVGGEKQYEWERITGFWWLQQIELDRKRKAEVLQALGQAVP
jgi:hypothetical protein